jgi:hypothetical protein
MLFASTVSAAYYVTRKVTGGFTETDMGPPRTISVFVKWKHAPITAPITMEEGDGPMMGRPPIT